MPRQGQDQKPDSAVEELLGNYQELQIGKLSLKPEDILIMGVGYMELFHIEETIKLLQKITSHKNILVVTKDVDFSVISKEELGE